MYWMQTAVSAGSYSVGLPMPATTTLADNNFMFGIGPYYFYNKRESSTKELISYTGTTLTVIFYGLIYVNPANPQGYFRYGYALFP